VDAARPRAADEDDPEADTPPPFAPPGDEERPAPRPSPRAAQETESDDADEAADATLHEADVEAEEVQRGPAASEAERSSTPAVLKSRSLSGFPNTVIAYHVYEVAPPDLTPAPLQPGEVPPLPRRLTPQPVRTLTFRDEKVAFGEDRCFTVRTVETTGSVSIESAASPTTCVSPRDTFPPKVPASLAAIASEGAIGLIWEGSSEPDLAGYIVLRGEAGGAALQPLMEAPIKETTYRDTTVTPGVRYVYAVVAVDTASPQNVSSQSNRVEETAR
jgi:hypothetical protein